MGNPRDTPVFAFFFSCPEPGASGGGGERTAILSGGHPKAKTNAAFLSAFSLHPLAPLDTSRIITAMPAPVLIYPPSFSATASLAPSDCARIEELTPQQRAELESGFAYIRAINHPDAPRRRKIEPLPIDFRIKVSAYCEELMARKTGIRTTAL